MKSPVLATILLLSMFTPIASAADLPEWFRPAAKNQAIQSFIEMMATHTEYYKISSIIQTDGKFESGEDASDVRISFGDSTACNARVFYASCIPIVTGKGNAVFCFNALTGCPGKTGPQ